MIRFFDIFFSLFGLIFLSPMLLVLSVWIKMDSKGPVLFKQIRIGRNGKEFTLYKFRSMQIGSDKNGLLTVGGNDSRITKSGIFIRKFKLDELPQLINVIFGDMSLVGPRPEVSRYVDLKDHFQMKVLSVRPGMTDYASIKYANENELLEQYADPEKAYLEIIKPDKLNLNMEFIQNYTVINYFKIILLTVKEILK